MNAALLQAVALLLTAPWWLPLAKSVVHLVRVASGIEDAGPEDLGNARVLERARGHWGSELRGARHVPRRLENSSWSTGRGPGRTAATATLRAGSGAGGGRADLSRTQRSGFNGRERRPASWN